MPGSTLAELADVLHLDPTDLEVAIAALDPADVIWDEDGVLSTEMVDDLHRTFDPNGERRVPELFPNRPPGTVVLPVNAALLGDTVHVPDARAGLPARVTRCGLAVKKLTSRDDVPDDATACQVCFDPDY